MNQPDPRPAEPLWFNKQQMREVARICNPKITDRKFNAMWAERMLAGRPT